MFDEKCKETHFCTENHLNCQRIRSYFHNIVKGHKTYEMFVTWFSSKRMLCSQEGEPPHHFQSQICSTTLTNGMTQSSQKSNVAVEKKYIPTKHEKSKLLRMFEICWWPPHARRSIGGEAASLLRTHPRLSNQHAALLLCFWRNTKSEKSVLAPPVRLVPRQAAGSVSALRKPNPYFDPSKLPTQFHAVACWIHESFEFSDRLFGCG